MITITLTGDEAEAYVMWRASQAPVEPARALVDGRKLTIAEIEARLLAALPCPGRLIYEKAGIAKPRWRAGRVLAQLRATGRVVLDHNFVFVAGSK